MDLEGIVVAFPARGTAAPVVLLHGLSLTVGAGELVVVAGRSGSGKTTLLNVAAGLIRPTSGTVRWSGQAISGLSAESVAERRRRTLGLVFQSAALISSLTAIENVALASVPNRTPGARERSQALLRLFGLETRGGHFPAQLSGGEQQRIALARALFADPPLLVIDEPTANLDRATADRLIETLAAIASDGRGLLVAAHDQHVLDAAHRVVYIEPE